MTTTTTEELREAQSRRELLALLRPLCWRWSGEIGHLGYGITAVDGKRRVAHRVEYERCFGPVPSGLVLDHLCMNRWCYNPAHLSVVTRAVNVDRGRMIAGTGRFASRCKHGHEWTPSNILYNERGLRVCKTCLAPTQSAYRARRPVAAR